MPGLNAKQIEILEGRGLDPELLDRLGVHSHPERGGDWLVIPYLRAGAVVNRKHRTIAGEKRFYQDKDAVKCFWNVDVITDKTLASEPLVICEGEFDAVVAMQAGFARVVSVPDGAPKEQIGEAEDGAKYSYVTDVLDALRSVNVVILATDGDGPGVNLMNDLALRLGRAKCRYVRYPEGCKDLNDVLMRHGVEAVRACLDRADWLAVKGMYRMSELPPLTEPAALPLGHAAVDQHIRVRRGDFQVVTGIPNMGKSTWVNEMACRLAMKHGAVTAFFSPEQRAQIDHRRALRWWKIGKPPMAWAQDEIAAADAWIDKHFVFLVAEDDTDATLDWVFETAAAAAIRHNATMISIDPWNELEHHREPGQTLTEYTGQAIKDLKRFARRFNVHTCVTAHPMKLQRDKKTGEYPVPTLYDISDSAHWYNKPDIGVVVHRTPASTVIRVEKVRYNGINGERGDIPVEFNRYTGRFQVREDLLPGVAANDDQEDAA
ncbi:toprim domain-containing protein [Azospirillum brasilense]|nr:toprim domain-containing protein [Azospirillum brasilense]